MVTRVTVVQAHPTPPPVKKVVIECSLQAAALIRAVLGGGTTAVKDFISSNGADPKYTRLARSLSDIEYGNLWGALTTALSSEIPD